MNFETPLPEKEDLNLLDFLIVLAKHKRLMWSLPAAFFVISVAYALLATPAFEGKTTMLPPQQQSGAAALMAQLGGLAGGAGGAALGLKNPNDMYVAMIGSETVARRLVARFKLQALYGDKTLTDALINLDRHTNVVSGKDGLIVVTVEDTDPKRAADMANAYVEELQGLTKRLAMTEAAQRRVFFEDKLKDAKQHLADAEVELKKIQEKTGVLQLEDQGRVAIESQASVKAEIAAKQVQLQVMGKSMTESNPEFARAAEALRGLNEQLQQMLEGGSGEDDIILAKSKAPEIGLQYVRKLRDVKYYETLFELMAKQYEMAKVDEASQGTLIQVVDYATVPEKKAKPKRALLVVLSTLAGLLLAVIVAFMKNALGVIRADPVQAKRLATLSQQLRRN